MRGGSGTGGILPQSVQRVAQVVELSALAVLWWLKANVQQNVSPCICARLCKDREGMRALRHMKLSTLGETLSRGSENPPQATSRLRLVAWDAQVAAAVAPFPFFQWNNFSTDR